MPHMIDAEDRRPSSPVATAEEMYTLLATAKTALKRMDRIDRTIDRLMERVRVLEMHRQKVPLAK